jgi:hypothetical protein
MISELLDKAAREGLRRLLHVPPQTRLEAPPAPEPRLRYSPQTPGIVMISTAVLEGYCLV